MGAPRIEIFTWAPADRALTDQERESRSIPLQIILSGAKQAMFEAFPRLRGPPVIVHQATAREVAEGPLAGHQAPVVEVDGRIVLEGPRWTEADVAHEVLRAIRGLPPSAEAAKEDQQRVSAVARKQGRRHARASGRDADRGPQG